MSNQIILEGLHKSFGDLKAVNNVSMKVSVGEILGFIGPNGSGKSTTMKMATGFLKADAGTTTICGVSVEANPKEAKKLIS